MSTPLRTRGRVWAYTGAILGGLISIAANVAHSFVAPIGAPDTWAPKPGAVVGSMFWPILLFVAVEILARVKWPKGFWWGLLRFGGMIPVALVAGLVSYRHLRSLLLFYGEDATIAWLGPLAVDGLMAMATAALIVTSLHHDDPSVPATVPAPLMVPSQINRADSYRPHAPAVTQRDHAAAIAPALSKHLLSTARSVLSHHHTRHDQVMTADQLSQIMNVPADVAGNLLAQLTPASVLNGSGGAQ